MSDKSKTILLVEDDEFYLSLIESWLKTPNNAVVTANDGQEALNISTNQPVDLIITDVFMPGMDGIELIKKIRISQPNIPIIAISGKSRKVDFMKAAEKFGATCTILKPLDQESFTRIVNEMLTLQVTEF
ncbi:MAG: response regulator [Gammaproteobacteria bacterium]|nr:response regulator [Gammaproteobacteria bacterium]